MTKKKKSPAKVDQKALPITGAKLLRVPRGDKVYPAAIFKGEGHLPAKGSNLSLKLENGITYKGCVLNVTESDGDVFVEFRDGLKPLDMKGRKV